MLNPHLLKLSHLKAGGGCCCGFHGGCPVLSELHTLTDRDQQLQLAGSLNKSPLLLLLQHLLSSSSHATLSSSSPCLPQVDVK
mmetsp:Transcript_25980/g.59785  ORF Transcript_25980/g.59785 Transcript_25980/m.59785 type:complete len:83 (+) Transcript_25980:147-395(+)